MEEVISIHLGQAGCQSGNALWELLCLEHDLTEEGELTTVADDCSPHSLFQETNNGQWVPRCLFLDLEATVVDCIRSGNHKKLHHPKNIINSTEDAANCWARGRFNTGKQIINETTERLRRLIECCESVQGFVKFYAVGGGTGGGFGTLLRDRVADEFFKKKQMVGASIFPSPALSTCIVEPYNTVLATHSFVLKNDINLVFDNEALYRLSMNKLGVKNPTYANLNRLIAQTVSSMTQSLRFDGELSMDFSELTTNLVPFPNINLLIGSLAPLQTDMEDSKDNYTVTDITMKAFANSNLMALCDLTRSSSFFMSCCLLYRGDVLPQNVNQALGIFKDQNKDRFVDWCPNMFKVGISYQPISTVPGSALPEARRSVTMFVNNTSVFDIIAKIQE